MSARDDLDKFDRDWVTCQRIIRQDHRCGLSVSAVQKMDGIEYKHELPPRLVANVRAMLDGAAVAARSELLALAKEEARRTLEELDEHRPQPADPVPEFS